MKLNCSDVTLQMFLLDWDVAGLNPTTSCSVGYWTPVMGNFHLCLHVEDMKKNQFADVESASQKTAFCKRYGENTEKTSLYDSDTAAEEMFETICLSRDNDCTIPIITIMNAFCHFCFAAKFKALRQSELECVPLHLKREFHMFDPEVEQYSQRADLLPQMRSVSPEEEKKLMSPI